MKVPKLILCNSNYIKFDTGTEKGWGGGGDLCTSAAVQSVG